LGGLLGYGLVRDVCSSVSCGGDVLDSEKKLSYTVEDKVKFELWAMSNLFPLVEYFWFSVSFVFGILS